MRNTSSDEIITVPVQVTRWELMLLGQLTDSSDARETLSRVVQMTVAMVEDCCG